MVFKGARFSRSDLREPHPHHCPLIQRPTRIRRRDELTAEVDGHTEFFPQFAVQGLLERLFVLDFASGKFPHSRELRRGSAPGHQKPRWVLKGIDNGRACHSNQSTHANSLGRTSHGPDHNRLEELVGAAKLGVPLPARRTAHSEKQAMTTALSSPAILKTPRQHPGMAIFALAMGGFAIGVTEFTMMGLLKEIEAGLDVSTPEAGNLISAYALGVVVGAPLFAAFGARLPRKRLAMGLMLFLALANLTSFIAPDYGTMLATRFASALPHGAFFGVAAVIAASLVAPARRGWAISMVMAGLSISNVIGVPVVTWLGQAFGWRLLFVVVGVIGLATVAMIWKAVPFEPAHADASIRRELGALKRLQVWLALLIGVIGFGGFFASYTYIAHTMTFVAGMPQAAIPVVVALYGLGMVFGTIMGGRIADKSVLGAICWVLPGIAAALVIYAFTARWAWAALVMVFVVGAIGSMLVPPLQARLLDASPDAPSLASSLNHSALNVANALGAFLGGVVIAWGWGFTAPALVGAVLAVLGLAVAGLSGLLERRKPLS